MNLSARTKSCLVVIFISFLVSYLITPLNYFPHFGLSSSFIILLLFIYKNKKDKTSDMKMYLFFSLTFSVFLFIRSDEVITFFNIIAILYFGMLSFSENHGKKEGYFDFVYVPLSFSLRSFLSKNNTYQFERKNKGGNIKKSFLLNNFVGILLTIIVITMVVPLLSSANPIFQKTVTDLYYYFQFDKLLNVFGLENIPRLFLKLFIALICIYILPRIITFNNKELLPFSLPTLLKNIPTKITIISLIIILFIFFLSQVQIYFANDQTLLNLGISHSQRTREVFAQLTFVAGIILFLLYNSRFNTTFQKILIWILGIQGMFLILTAFNSVNKYINTWGLTYKRLYGLTFIAWITGIFILLFINYLKNNSSALFVKKSVIYSAILLIFVNVLNFDYLIYHFKKSETEQGADYTYLSSLSADSLSFKDQFEIIIKEKNSPTSTYGNKNPEVIFNKIEALQNKYRNLDLRALTILDYLQYREIRSLNTKMINNN